MPLEIRGVYLEVVHDPDADLSWLEQTPRQLGSLEAAVWNRRRLQALERGEWEPVGVRLVADVALIIGGGETQRCRFLTPGIWSVESDSGDDYFQAIADEDAPMLADDLGEVGFPESEILAWLGEPGHRPIFEIREEA